MSKKKPSSNAIRILRSATAEDWLRIADKIVEINRPVSTKWLVDNGFPDDVVRAVQIAVAELGEFVHSQDVDEFPTDNIRELLQTCVDRRQWLARINKPTSSASTVDQQRLKFYNDQQAKDSTLRYKKIAQLWCEKHPGDICDETAFKQSCYRARKNVTT